MKNIARLPILLSILLVLLAGCKKNAGQIEETPDWEVFHKYYKESDYKDYLMKNINSLTDKELIFSQPIIEYYKKAQQPIWTANGLQEKLVEEYLELYQHSEEHGLPTEMFGFQIIKDDINYLKKGEIKNADDLYRKLSEVEVLMARSNVLYAKSMAYGATDPVEVNGGKWLYKNDSMPEDFLRNAMQEAPKGTQHLTALHPTDTVYVALQKEMRKFLALRDEPWDTIPYFSADSGQCVRNVHLIGERLLKLQEISENYTPNDTLGKVLMPAINRFRENRAIPRSRKLDEETFKALNRTPDEYIAVLAANMERCRWKRKHTKGSNFIAVNIPDFMLEARCDDTVALRSKICCGKYRRKGSEDSCRVNGILPAVKSESPLLYSEVTSIVLNPEWRIPYSIIKDEYYYKMVKNCVGVCQKEKLYITDNRIGKQVHPENVDWKKVSRKNIPYQLTQTSGKHNALGLYKFNIPNTESVYLHSTNNPGAFNHRKRDFSHGCVRVQLAAELAEVLFLMNDYDTTRLEEVSIILGNEPTTEDGEKYLEKKLEREEKYVARLTPEEASFYRPLRPTSLVLQKKMPVFIEYHTAFIGPNGDVHYRNDVYHKDKNITNALQKLIPKSEKDA